MLRDGVEGTECKVTISVSHKYILICLSLLAGVLALPVKMSGCPSNEDSIAMVFGSGELGMLACEK